MDDIELSKELGIEVVDSSQVEEKVKVKRNTSVLKKIRVLLNGNDWSFDEIYQALGDCSSSKTSVKSMLSQYVSKGLLVKTDKGYKLKEVSVIDNVPSGVLEQ